MATQSPSAGAPALSSSPPAATGVGSAAACCGRKRKEEEEEDRAEEEDHAEEEEDWGEDDDLVPLTPHPSPLADDNENSEVGALASHSDGVGSSHGAVGGLPRAGGGAEAGVAERPRGINENLSRPVKRSRMSPPPPPSSTSSASARYAPEESAYAAVVAPHPSLCSVERGLQCLSVAGSEGAGEHHGHRGATAGGSHDVPSSAAAGVMTSKRDAGTSGNDGGDEESEVAGRRMHDRGGDSGGRMEFSAQEKFTWLKSPFYLPTKTAESTLPISEFWPLQAETPSGNRRDESCDLGASASASTTRATSTSTSATTTTAAGAAAAAATGTSTSTSTACASEDLSSLQLDSLHLGGSGDDGMQESRKRRSHGAHQPHRDHSQQPDPRQNPSFPRALASSASLPSLPAPSAVSSSFLTLHLTPNLAAPAPASASTPASIRSRRKCDHLEEVTEEEEEEEEEREREEEGDGDQGQASGVSGGRRQKRSCSRS